MNKAIGKWACKILGHKFSTMTMEFTTIGAKAICYCGRCGHEDTHCLIDPDKFKEHQFYGIKSK